jgi:hypothetical protein
MEMATRMATATGKLTGTERPMAMGTEKPMATAMAPVP